MAGDGGGGGGVVKGSLGGRNCELNVTGFSDRMPGTINRLRWVLFGVSHKVYLTVSSPSVSLSSPSPPLDFCLTRLKVDEPSISYLF